MFKFDVVATIFSCLINEPITLYVYTVTTHPDCPSPTTWPIGHWTTFQKVMKCFMIVKCVSACPQPWIAVVRYIQMVENNVGSCLEPRRKTLIISVHVFLTAICIAGYLTRVVATILDLHKLANIIYMLVLLNHIVFLTCLVWSNTMMKRAIVDSAVKPSMLKPSNRNLKYDQELSKTIMVINVSFVITWLSENSVIIVETLFQIGAIDMAYSAFATVTKASMFLNLLFPFNGGFNSAVYLLRVKRLRRYYAKYLRCNKTTEEQQDISLIQTGNINL